MIDFSSPLQGMQGAESRLNVTASRIARASLPQAQPQQDTVDLSAEMVALLQDRSDYETNVKVAKTMDEMTQSTLSIVG